MKMKKILALALCLMMVFSLAACSSSSSDSDDTVTVTKLSMASGGTSGTYYGYCGIIAQTLNSAVDSLNITVESTGASMANIQLIEAGESDLAIVQNDVMSYAYNGVSLFTEPVTNFYAVMSCYPETIQIVANSSITSVEDMAGKVISVGAADSGTRFNAEQILAVYGISFDDCTIVYESFADSVDSIKNGTVDAAFVVAGAPTTAVTELATTYSFNLVQLDDEHIEALQADYGFYTKEVIPAGTYSCVTEDVTTVAVMATIIAADDVSDEAIYAFLEGVFENQEEIATGHAKGELIDLDTAVSGVDISFHPGAVAYYADQGYEVA